MCIPMDHHNEMVQELRDRETELRARLAEVEAERDARPTWDVFGDCLSQETKRRKAAEARLAAVEALRVAADHVGLRYVSVTMLSDALRGKGDQ